MKIVKFPEDTVLLMKGVAETIENETKEQSGGFLDMLLGTLGASLLRNMLAGTQCSGLVNGFRDLERVFNATSWLA